MEALQPLPEKDWRAAGPPDISHIITEDDTPVDNMFSEKQQRLLTESLNISWRPGRPFLAAANVGIFYATHEPPIVPDMFLSLDVRAPDDLWEKRNRSYFLWEYGKPPEVAVEVVSNTKGGEASGKFVTYAKVGVRYYVILDPLHQIQQETLRVYELASGSYIPKLGSYLPGTGLGVKLWEGVFEEAHDCWLRWCDRDGRLISSGTERAEQAENRANSEHERAEKQRILAEKQRMRADSEHEWSEILLAKLRSMGVDPDSLKNG